MIEYKILEKRRLRPYRVASESVEQRKQRLEYNRRYSAHRIATESFEQRLQRLENRRLRALRESVEQREQRLENTRRRRAHRIATESFEQRQQRLEKRRLRASRESVEQREQRLENDRRRVAHRKATESFEQRQQRLEKRRLRVSRVASESVEQRKQCLEYMRRYSAHRVATESDEQHQQRLEKQRLQKRCRARLGRPAAVMEHGANECTEELLHSEIIIKTEVDEAAQSCDYFVVEFDLNQVKEKPGLVQYAKSEPALLVKEEILEDSGEDGNEQQSVQGTPIPAGTRSGNEACSARLGDLINIKHEPSDVDVGPTVLQHMDIHYTINKLDVDAIKQEDALLSLDTEEALSTINNGQCVHSKVKDETIDDSQEERGYSIKRSRIRKDYSRNPSRKHHILQD